MLWLVGQCHQMHGLREKRLQAVQCVLLHYGHAVVAALAIATIHGHEFLQFLLYHGFRCSCGGRWIR